MCGICGVVNLGGGEPGISGSRFVAMREGLTHRGPDGAGEFAGPGVLLGHRRLIVLDPSEGGRQPMVTGDGRFVLVYNGELYNDRELRAELERAGVVFRSSCDTETVLHAVARWGAGAGERMRGMYALALWDTAERVLLLGRDGFGMKPLVWARAGDDVVFASEARVLFEHPGVRPEPDVAVVSSYISTMRETLDERTMFDGVRRVRPGEWLRFGVGELGEPGRVESVYAGGELGGVGEVVEGSIRAHLRSDVPWCSLLSGGLDSTIVATVAAERADGLRTYVSGCREAGEGLADDFGFAREAAEAVGSVHREVPVDRACFGHGWAEIVERTGLPLTTPNTVAIWEVAKALRADGHVVTLSGEGADELFGGYELPLASMAGHVAATPGGGDGDGAYALRSTAWLQPAQKGEFLDGGFWGEVGEDALVERVHAEAVARARAEALALHPGVGEDELRMLAYLGFQRRLNLTGLLQRLDAATMLASVEGRTPFADGAVAAVAGRLGMGEKFVAGEDGVGVDRTGHRSKIALREAFRGRVPGSIVDRPKRSFPLPFAGWLDGMEGAVRGSGLVKRVYSPVAVEVAFSDPGQWWNLAWPMANLAMWGRRWWDG